MEVIVVQAMSEFTESELVGVYGSFDAAVEGADGHRGWFGNPDEGYMLTALLLGYNNTARHPRRAFFLRRGEVPHWWLGGSKFADRFSLQTEDKE